MLRLLQRMTLIVFFALVGTSFSSFSTQSNSQQLSPTHWELLGTRKVNYGLDRDVISVGRHEGSFTKLKVLVSGGGINMHKMVVVYGNGKRDELSLRHNFRRGSDSRIIDLNGGNRVIKQVIFWYDTKNISQRRARVRVFGRH